MGVLGEGRSAGRGDQTGEDMLGGRRVGKILGKSEAFLGNPGC